MRGGWEKEGRREEGENHGSINNPPLAGSHSCPSNVLLQKPASYCSCDWRTVPCDPGGWFVCVVCDCSGSSVTPVSEDPPSRACLHGRVEEVTRPSH